MDRPPLTILVVDDNPVTRVMCTRVLEREGYRVELAEDGIEALQKVKENPIHLVLLDVMMPGLSGFDVLADLRKLFQPEELRVLMVTAKDRSEDVVRAFELGADDYVTKPLDIPVLLARIQAHLRSRPRRAEAGTAVLEFQPGAVIGDGYRLESVIGKGSFGTVFRATQLSLERPVAVKIFTSGLRSKQAASRFRREAISTCRIDHPNAVAVLDLSFAEGDVPFLVMELLEGQSLASELKKGEQVSLTRCVDLLNPICAVLKDAHGMGIVHRDIKPQNIFLHRTRQGEIVKVLDFGIAKLMDDSMSEDKLTIDGLLGTPSYMAPERFGGDPCEGSADVYSVGVVLYEMVTGQRPFDADGDLFRLIVQHMNKTPLAPRELCPELPEAIEKLILQTLEKDPHARPSAADLAQRFTTAVRASSQ